MLKTKGQKARVCFLLQCVLCLLFLVSFTVIAVEDMTSDRILIKNSFLTIAYFSIVAFLANVLALHFILRREKKLGRVGLLRFFSNGPAKAADLLLIISIIAFSAYWIISERVTAVPISGIFIPLGAMLTFLALHGMFNGRAYYFLAADRPSDNKSNKKAVREEQENEG